MKTERLLTYALFLSSSIVLAQNDGDQTITTGGGVTFLAPDTLVGIGVAPVRFNVGTVGTGFSLLQVSGHQLGSGEVFRTNSTWYAGAGGPYGTDSHWRLYRASGSATTNFGIEMGEIYCRNGVAGSTTGNLGFNIQFKRLQGSLWLRNRRGELLPRRVSASGPCVFHSSNTCSKRSMGAVERSPRS